MLGHLFSFSGRLGRLHYFGLTVMMAGAVGIVYGVLLIRGVSVVAKGGHLAELAGMGLLALVGVIPFVWSSFAMTAKRLRDAGFPPGLVIPGMILFSLFDQLVLSRMIGNVGGNPIAQVTVVGIAVSLIYTGVIFFWPSAGDRETPNSTPKSRLSNLAESDPSAWARMLADPVPAGTMPSAPNRASAPVTAQSPNPTGARTTFGQRKA